MKIIQIMFVSAVFWLTSIPASAEPENNLKAVLDDAKQHNNIQALALIEYEAWLDNSVYTRIGVTETQFKVLKEEICHKNLMQAKDSRDRHEDDEYSFQEICGKYTAI